MCCLLSLQKIHSKTQNWNGQRKKLLPNLFTLKGFFGANGRLAQKKAEEEKKNQMEENGEVYVPIGKVLI